MFTANQPLRTEQFGQSLTSELDGNPPLWVTRRPGARGHEVFINNARIIEGSNYESRSGHGENDRKIQVSVFKFSIIYLQKNKRKNTFKYCRNILSRMNHENY